MHQNVTISDLFCKITTLAAKIQEKIIFSIKIDRRSRSQRGFPHPRCGKIRLKLVYREKRAAYRNRLVCFGPNWHNRLNNAERFRRFDTLYFN